jgi:hypothetical protein
VAQPLREAIRSAVSLAVLGRSTYDVWVEDDNGLRANVCAAVDGSLELLTADYGPLRGLFKRSRDALDADAMTALGFRSDDEGTWTLALPAGMATEQRAVDALERLFTGPFGRSLDEAAELEMDFPGLVPGAPVPPPDAPHAEHIEAALGIFDVDARAEIMIATGLPSRLRLHVSQVGDGRVRVQIGDPEDARFADYDRDGFPPTAAELLHRELGVPDRDPLFVYLVTDVNLRARPRA